MRRIQERDGELRELKHKLGKATSQVEDMRTQLHIKEHEVAELSEDLQTLTRENQFTNNELVKAQ